MSGIDLVEEDGTYYPTAHCMVYILHLTMQRKSDYSVRPPSSFPGARPWFPEIHSTQSVKGAWRPFEHGPRNCIAQLLAVLEIKMVLAMTVREFDVNPAYEEWDRLYPEKD